jgi:UrcA family protein
MSNRLIKLLPLAAALALSGIAVAGSRSVPSVVVSYADLNLNSSAGVTSLHHRIRNAAETVCSQLQTRVLGLREAYEQCVDDAISSSVAAVDNANLSNYHQAPKGRVLASN